MGLYRSTKHLIQELFQITSYIQFCIVWDDMRHDVCVLPVYVYVVSCMNAVTFSHICVSVIVIFE